jgi:hypothetical protein
MYIYLDTMMWDELYDQAVEANLLVRALAEKDKYLVLGTENIYEMAKTFSINADRAKNLFIFLKTFTDLDILCANINPTLLDAEIISVIKDEPYVPDPFLNPANYERMRTEVFKLAQGKFDARASDFITERKNIAANDRALIAANYSIPSTLKNQLRKIKPEQLAVWIRKAVAHSGRTLLKQRLRKHYPSEREKDITRVAKKLLSSNFYALANAAVRADLYTNWRTANRGSMSRDLLPCPVLAPYARAGSDAADTIGFCS